MPVKIGREIHYGSRELSRRILLTGLAVICVAWSGSSAVFGQGLSNGPTRCPQPPEPNRLVAPTRIFDLIEPVTGTATLGNPLAPDRATSTLTIVALGDSVMWGNGLKNSDKFIIQVGQEIANKTQRKVHIVSSAHSGAKLAAQSNEYVPIIADDHGLPQGDLNAGSPTTSQQADCAAIEYPDAEIVLLDGCINEAGATNIALPPPLSRATAAQIVRDSFVGVWKPHENCPDQCEEFVPDCHNRPPQLLQDRL
jgi:hypothetical protein